MDVLYTIGERSKHDNQELRWSLRSLVKYGKNLGKIIVAGYPPDWLADSVIKVNVPRTKEDLHKFSSILKSIIVCAEKKIVDGDFLLSSDDHFLSKDFDLESTPFYKKRDHLPLKLDELTTGGTSYRKCLYVTGEILRNHGYSDIQSNFHKNTRLNSSVVDEVKQLIDLEKSNPLAEHGYEATILFQNVYAKHNQVDFQKTRDWKLEEYKQEAIDSGAFSISDKVFSDKRFIDYMNAEFGKPCIYEKYF